MESSNETWYHLVCKWSAFQFSSLYLVTAKTDTMAWKWTYQLVCQESQAVVLALPRTCHVTINKCLTSLVLVSLYIKRNKNEQITSKTSSSLTIPSETYWKSKSSGNESHILYIEKYYTISKWWSLMLELDVRMGEPQNPSHHQGQH